MGFFAKLFGLKTRCPACGAEWAKESLFSGVKCVSPDCQHYDRAYAARVFESPLTGSCPACGSEWAKLASFTDVKCMSPKCNHYNAQYATAGFDKPLTIEYVNFRGEQKTFTCDSESIRVKRAHINVRVAPTGRRIALKAASITNRDEIERRAAGIG
jgi:predicted Zn-ribbon and HTH transcriptional regulator